jgi:outer membrane protein OmpA-like peptidoglycan-associated protein
MKSFGHKETSAASASPAFFQKKAAQDFFETASGPSAFFSSKFSGIQTKLSIGEPNDKYEQEADAMADKVVQRLATPEPLIQKDKSIQTKPLATTITPFIQTKCAACEQEEKVQKKERNILGQNPSLELQRKSIFETNAEFPDENNIQRKCAECEKEEKKELQKKGNNNSVPEASPAIESNLNSSKGKGNPLTESSRTEMESFGVDFSNVQIHDDNAAVEMSKGLNAQAFTHGNDIYFNSGKFDTESSAGKHFLAHELTHVIQQSNNNIQRLVAPSIPLIKEHGDLAQVPGDVKTNCNIATTSPTAEQPVPYTHNSSKLSKPAAVVVNEFAKEWHRRGANADVRIDGYASLEGGDPLNWRLSCSRAMTVKKGLMHPSDGSPGIPESFITIHAHGETNRFDLTKLSPNRLATITSAIRVNPTPPTPPPAPPTPPTSEKICGPDVSGEVASVWRRIQSDFGGWSFGQKESACRYLIQPIVQNPSTGNWGLNKDAFDTLGLFLNTAGWTQRLPYHPPCGVPGSRGNPCNNRDPLHESLSTCSNTVKVGSGCWLTGTANYGTYGVMMKLCSDWVNDPIARLLLPNIIWAALNQAFSYSTMVALITAYKLYDQENPAWPIAWSSATYLGGPSSTPPGTNRPDCQPTCSVPFSTPSFDYVWEPTKPRGPIGPQYGYPCSTTSP